MDARIVQQSSHGGGGVDPALEEVQDLLAAEQELHDPSSVADGEVVGGRRPLRGAEVCRLALAGLAVSLHPLPVADLGPHLIHALQEEGLELGGLRKLPVGDGPHLGGEPLLRLELLLQALHAVLVPLLQLPGEDGAVLEHHRGLHRRRERLLRSRQGGRQSARGRLPLAARGRLPGVCRDEGRVGRGLRLLDRTAQGLVVPLCLLDLVLQKRAVVLQRIGLALPPVQLLLVLFAQLVQSQGLVHEPVEPLL
mmetsp:Transcript_35913/g.97290  ORF Transcript_35913/g.97290 Transcript_35913/m.97290 type:complete len:252 (+) Transcript_35913:185-940(+)